MPKCTSTDSDFCILRLAQGQPCFVHAWAALSDAGSAVIARIGVALLDLPISCPP